MLFLFGLSLVIFSCEKAQETQFTKLDSDKTNIDFVNENRETERSNILTYEYFYNGGGVALGDINNDGLLDIYFTSNIFENRLYLNKGNLEFDDITEASGAGCQVGWKTGVTMADINSDGWLDIYVCRSASPDPDRRRNILLINNGDNTFTDRAKDYGLDDPSYSTQAAFFDFDHDDDLDVILLNHSLLEISNSFLINLRNLKTRYPHVGNKLLRNDDGRFIDVSDSIGVYGPASNYGLGISLSDIDNDGWIDIYAGCDYTGRDRLLSNIEGKFFRDTTSSLSHISKFTMGTDIADINADGWMDIFTVDMLPEDNKRQKQLFGTDRYDVFSNMVRNGLHKQYMRNMLHVNNQNGSFSEVGQFAGVSNTDWSWGALFADFNNDGVQDLFVTNGFKRDLTDNDFAKFQAQQEMQRATQTGRKKSVFEIIDRFTENKIPNYMFQGSDSLTFIKRTVDWGFDEHTLTHGVAYGDLDNDGDLDLVTNNMNSPAGVYRNNQEKFDKNHFLKVQLSGKGENASAIGGKVVLHAGNKVFAREQLPTRGFQSSVDPVLHFGLGKISSLDSVCVYWPDGSQQTLKDITVDQKVDLQQNDTTKTIRVHNAAPYFVETASIPFKHTENKFVDFYVQPLLPRMYSTLGPAMAQADVNGDGLLDIYAGGAKGQSGALFLQNHFDRFEKSDQAVFKITSSSEEIDAVFFDMDNDKDMDLFIVTGGYEFAPNDSLLKDRLFKNDGRGNFSEVELPGIFQSGSCVRPADVDRDGDIDLFVGGRLIPGQYPATPQSVLLLNDGRGNFVEDRSQSHALLNAGLVTDAAWLDLNGDMYDDLVLVGEWMPVKVFINENSRLVERSSEFIHESSEGWWTRILSEDFDKDGDLDLVLGNHGTNNQMKVTEAEPATLVYSDFDQNGSLDPLLTYYIQGKNYPYATRDELTEQLPSFKKRFTDYKSYSTATLDDVLTEQEKKDAHVLKASRFSSSFLRNDGGKFTFQNLPSVFQFAPISDMAALDVNGDGHLDILAVGNLTATRARTGALTGNTGVIALGDGSGHFTAVSPRQSGLCLTGDVRRILVNGSMVTFGCNNDRALSFKFR